MDFCSSCGNSDRVKEMGLLMKIEDWIGHVTICYNFSLLLHIYALLFTCVIHALNMCYTHVVYIFFYYIYLDYLLAVSLASL